MYIHRVIGAPECRQNRQEERQLYVCVRQHACLCNCSTSRQSLCRHRRKLPWPNWHFWSLPPDTLLNNSQVKKGNPKGIQNRLWIKWKCKQPTRMCGALPKQCLESSVWLWTLMLKRKKEPKPVSPASILSLTKNSTLNPAQTERRKRQR